MAVTVLKIPTGANTFIEGECQIAGFEGLLLAQTVSFDIDVDSVIAEDGKRTVHLPKVSQFTIERKVDLGTADLTKFALSGRVSPQPWLIFFLRTLGGYTLPADTSAQVTFVRYLTLKLHQALITSQSISFEAGDMTETLQVSAAQVEWDYYFHGSAQQKVGHLTYKFDLQKGEVT